MSTLLFSSNHDCLPTSWHALLTPRQESKTVSQLSSRERAAFFISFLGTISLLPPSLEAIKLLAQAAPSLASSLRLSELDVTQQWLLFTK
jgi:hypothetical protein